MRYYHITNRRFEWRPCVYFVCRRDRKVIYIGATFDAQRRLINHEKYEKFIENDAYFYYVLYFRKDDWDNAFWYEKFYISKYVPILNKPTRDRKKLPKIYRELDPFTLELSNW